MQLPSPIPHPLDLMPWEVPGWAHGLLEFAVGVDWPQGDEKAVWDLADRWLAAASTLVDPGEEAGVAAGEVLSGYGGAGLVANAFEHAWRQVGVGEDAPLPIVIALCHELGGLVEGCGADIEAAKLEVYVELSLLLIELAALAVMVFLTFGAASPAAGAAAMATRLSIQQILRRLAVRLGAKALRQGAKEAAAQATKQISRRGFTQLAKRAGREALEEAAEEAATRMGTQAYQNSTGRRHGVDLGSVGWSAMAGAAGGGAASAAHLGPQARGRLSGIGEGVARGAGGEVLADVAATLATGTSPGLDGLAEAATSGGADHGVRHGTHELDQHLAGGVGHRRTSATSPQQPYPLPV